SENHQELAIALECALTGRVGQRDAAAPKPVAVNIGQSDQVEWINVAMYRPEAADRARVVSSCSPLAGCRRVGSHRTHPRRAHLSAQGFASPTRERSKICWAYPSCWQSWLAP